MFAAHSPRLYRIINGPRPGSHRVEGLAQVRNPGVSGNYTVDHSTALVLIDPQARLVACFTPPHYIGALAADLASIHGRQP